MTRTADRTDPPRDESGLRPAANRESLAAGTLLDDFEILRTIGSGGFGTVYLARDRSLEREVAIKEFLPTQLAFRASGLRVAVRTPELEPTYSAGLRSFVNEAKILARFNHPAVVKVHRFWEANGTAYMVMPYVRGPRLRDVRRSMRAAPTEAWLRTVIDPLLDAIAMLHAQGIYHRDVAPDNILLPSAHDPVLLDFGAARRVIGDRTQTLTAVLKPSYAPIEQYAEGTTLRQGPWTDLYALAAVVVYMLNALPPPPSTVRALHDEMPLLTENPPPGVSAEFLAAIQWALAVRPQDRPQSVQEFKRALDGQLSPPRPRTQAPTTDAAGGLTTPAAEPAGQPPQDDSPATAEQRRRDMAAAAPFALHEDQPVFAHADSATWDTTIRLASTTSPRPGSGGAPPPTGVAQRARASARSTLVIAVAAFGLLAGGLFSMLRGVPVELDASTWRELANQAPPAEGARGVEPADEPAQRVAASAAPAAPAPAPSSDNPAAALRTVAATSNGNGVERLNEPGSSGVSLRAGLPTSTLATDAPGSRLAPVKAADKHAAQVTSKRTTPRGKAYRVAQLGPREVCSDHNFFTVGFCVSRRCDEPRFRKHPQCVQLQRDRDDRLRHFDFP